MLGQPASALLGENVGFPMITDGPIEVDVVTRDGSERVAEMQVAEVEWDGQPAFVAALRDVTGRKRLEERLRRASQTLEAIVQASPLPVVQLGPDFSVNFWNAAADDLFSEPDRLARGAPLPIARDARNRDLFRVSERLALGESGVRVEALYHRDDGNSRELAVFASALRDHDGGVTGMVVILEPIASAR
jgi:PAS domain S-box-containing protein